MSQGRQCDELLAGRRWAWDWGLTHFRHGDGRRHQFLGLCMRVTCTQGTQRDTLQNDLGGSDEGLRTHNRFTPTLPSLTGTSLCPGCSTSNPSPSLWPGKAEEDCSFPWALHQHWRPGSSSWLGISSTPATAAIWGLKQQTDSM